MSPAGRLWLERYLAEFNLIKDLVLSECSQVFRFGEIDKRHISNKMIELPLLMGSMNGREYTMKAILYVIEAYVVFLCGYRTLEHWSANMDIRRIVLETNI